MDSDSQLRQLTYDDQLKLKELLKEGVKVLSETQLLRDGLNDAVKALAEEMQVKPSLLKKCIRTAYKSDFDQLNSDHMQLENLLSAAGVK